MFYSKPFYSDQDLMRKNKSGLYSLESKTGCREYIILLEITTHHTSSLHGKTTKCTFDMGDILELEYRGDDPTFFIANKTKQWMYLH